MRINRWHLSAAVFALTMLTACSLTPSQRNWTGLAAALVVGAIALYRRHLTRRHVPYVDRYCAECKRIAPWHPDDGCAVCEQREASTW